MLTSATSHDYSKLSWQRFPWMMLVAAVALCMIGILGIMRGDDLVHQGTNAFKQQIWGLLSCVVLILMTTFHYRLLKPISSILFVGSLLLTLSLYFFPVVNGARSWLRLGPIAFQPSELVKISYILVMSQYLMYRENYRHWWGLFVPFVITAIPLGIILKEPDLGTAMLFIPMLLAMLFVAGARPRHLLLVIFLGLLLIPAAWTLMNSEQKSRVTTLFQQEDGGLPPRGDGYHLYQSKYILSQGGIWGSSNWEIKNEPAAALDTEEQLKNYHLPAARTDFIYCLVGEYYGFAGVVLVQLFYLLLFFSAIHIASQTREPFGRLVITGIVTLLGTQVVINTGMTVGLMPITGLTLPLLSYGGSSLLSTALALGLIINIALRPGYELTGEPFRYRS